MSNPEQSARWGAGSVEGVKRRPSVASFLGPLLAGKTSRLYPEGEAVFIQGEAASAVFYLQKGKVALTTVSPQGRQAAIATLDRGSFFGEGCLGGQTIRMATARAVEPCTIVGVEPEVMRRLLRREPGFAALFAAHVLSRHARSEQALIEGLFPSSEKRLAGALLSLTRLGRTAYPARVDPAVTDDDLASMLGITRARVGEIMTGFQEMGFIAYERGGLNVLGGLLTVVLQE